MSAHVSPPRPWYAKPEHWYADRTMWLGIVGMMLIGASGEGDGGIVGGQWSLDFLAIVVGGVLLRASGFGSGRRWETEREL